MKQNGDLSSSPTTSWSLSRLTAYAVTAIACLTIIGWLLDITLLKSIGSDWNSMKIVTAICLILSAVGLAWLQADKPWKRTLCAVFSVAVCAAAVTSLIVYATVLFTGRVPSWTAAPALAWFLGPTDRMAAVTALLFLGLGCALLLLRTGSRRLAGAAHVLVLPLAVISYLVLAGYVFNAPSLHDWLGVSVALHTGIAFCLLCVGTLCARMDTWLMNPLASREAGGIMARWLLPPLTVLPLAIGWVRVYGERAGIFESEVGVALVAATYAVCFLVLVWLGSTMANRQQRKAEESLRAARDRLDLQVRERTAELSRTIQTLRDEAAQRTLAEQKAQATALYARNLLEANLDPLVTISPDGKVTDVNAATELVTGVSRAQLIDSDFSNYFTESEKANAGYQQVLRDGAVRDYPMTIRHASGRTTDVLYNATVYRNEAGEVQGVFAAARDVTERKRSESALRESEQRYRMLFETMDEGFCVVEMLHSADGKPVDYRFVEINPAFEKHTGLQQALGKTIRELVPDHDAHWFEIYGEVARTGEAVHFENRAASMKRWFDVHAFRLGGPQSRRVALLFNNITERKRMEEELRVVSRYSRSLIEASLDPLVTISPDGKITDVSAATELVTGVPRERLVGSDFSNYFTQPTKANAGYQQVLRDGEVRDYPLTIRHTSGRTTDVLYNATVYRNEAGEVQGVFAAARDVTERNMMEQELAQHRLHLEELVEQRTSELEKTTAELARSNKDLEQFAYVASHDLQEPLRAVGGFMFLLKQQLKDKLDADGHEYIGHAIGGAERMQTMINDLLAYSRVGTKGGTRRPVGMKEALDLAVGNLSAAIEESHAVIRCDPLPTVTADPSQMVQLLQNLIGNAIKFRGPRAPEIHVGARREENVWVFGIRDNGIGIEQKYHDRIFLIFQRLHSRTDYPGTGIGLALCKKIVERHSGRIWFTSQPGEGTTFFFTISDTGSDE